MFSCILVCTVFIPCRGDIDDKPDEVGKNKIENANHYPLANVEIVGHFEFFWRVDYFIIIKIFIVLGWTLLVWVDVLGVGIGRHIALFNY